MNKQSFFEISSLGITYSVLAQPIINAKNNLISSLELLSRSHGVCDPEAYFASMSNYSLTMLSCAQIDEACNVLSNSIIMPKININADQNMIGDIYLMATLMQYKSHIKILLEINPFELMDDNDIDKIKRRFDFVKMCGHELWLDDHDGSKTGCDNIDLFPWDGVKIDKSVLWSNDFSKLKDIVDFCHQRSMPVTIEGVESEYLFQQAVKSGADYLQGFYWPMITKADLPNVS
ncbi:EAL domain-containing protein [Cetobacterium somerae]|uniref:EAL domain-containing protein n=1 Tax=Cetobacterium somerae TaxID=188913 RepID=UPI00224DBA0C|nr:EAL domain-containing protein [Cetobacterium somerae]MCX3068614.1 EAL domain-containing protein [Cetobacterium somerae]